MLKTSIVIPSKNSGKFIEKCLESIKPYYDQGYIEDIVLVDAFSTDDTVEIASRYPVKIITDDSGYPAPSWEKGWRNANGDLVIFFDSDAYFGEGLFPKLLEYFEDEKIGIVSCEAEPVGADDKLTRAENQWAEFRHEACFQTGGFFHRFVRKARLKNESVPPPSGPCWITRRSIIESVDGYRGFPVRVEPDTALPRRIMDQGWNVSWWLRAPVYHYTRTTIKGLLKRCAHQGRQAAFWMRELGYSPLRQITTMAVELGAPLLGIVGMIRWKNPWFFVFSLTRYVAVFGYLAGLGVKSGEKIQ